MDKDGDIALGFSVDNTAALDPSIWFTGRLPTDKLNKLEGTSWLIKEHTYREPSSLGRLQLDERGSNG